MSEEQLIAFLKKVSGDAGLQEKLRASGADPIAIASGCGFQVSEEDLLKFRDRFAVELSDGDLEEVAGGFITEGLIEDAVVWGAEQAWDYFNDNFVEPLKKATSISWGC